MAYDSDQNDFSEIIKIKEQLRSSSEASKEGKNSPQLPGLESSDDVPQVTMSPKEKIKFVIIHTIGNFLVLFAVFGVFATFGPALYYEFGFRVMQLRGIRYSVVHAEPKIQKTKDVAKITHKKTVGFGDVLAGPKEQILVPKDTYFNIVIPKIGVNEKIFPNVDPANADNFLPVLQEGVAHAQGTVFPGQKGTIYIFAHSTDNFWNVGRYNAVFYLLKDLGKNDEIVIFFQNKRYNYIVDGTKVVESSEVSYITEAQKGREEVLVLQTCWPPGTTWKRLLVFSRPK